MPDIDLGPDDYKKQVKGRWVVPDDPRLAKWMFFLASLMVAGGYFAGFGYVYAAIFGLCAGGLLTIWLRDVY